MLIKSIKTLWLIIITTELDLLITMIKIQIMDLIILMEIKIILDSLQVKAICTVITMGSINKIQIFRIMMTNHLKIVKSTNLKMELFIKVNGKEK